MAEQEDVTTGHKDGGPAFPFPATWTPEGVAYDCGEFGMSLRDWFAGMALQGIGTWAPLVGNPLDLRTKDAHERRAAWAYDAADAMLAERNKP